MAVSTLDQPIRSIARYDVQTGNRADTVRAMARRMREADCSALVIAQRDGEIGIVTERDIVAAIADGGDPDREWAVDVMTTEVMTVDATATVADVVELMSLGSIRHVVVDDDGRLAVVSIRDLLDPILETTP